MFDFLFKKEKSNVILLPKIETKMLSGIRREYEEVVNELNQYSEEHLKSTVMTLGGQKIDLYCCFFIAKDMVKIIEFMEKNQPQKALEVYKRRSWNHVNLNEVPVIKKILGDQAQITIPKRVSSYNLRLNTKREDLFKELKNGDHASLQVTLKDLHKYCVVKYRSEFGTNHSKRILSNTGKYLLTSSRENGTNGKIVVHDLEYGDKWERRIRGVDAYAFDPQDELLAVNTMSDESSTITLFDFKTGLNQRVLTLNDWFVTPVCLYFSGKILLMGGMYQKFDDDDDDDVSVNLEPCLVSWTPSWWHLNHTGTLIKKIQGDVQSKFIALTVTNKILKDGRYVETKQVPYIALYPKNKIQDLSGNYLATFEGYNRILFASKPEYIILGKDNGVVSIYYPDQNEEVTLSKTGITDFDVSPNGNILTTISDKELVFWDLNTATEKFSVQFTHYYDIAHNVLYSKDGETIAVLTTCGLNIYDTSNGRYLAYIDISRKNESEYIPYHLEFASVYQENGDLNITAKNSGKVLATLKRGNSDLKVQQQQHEYDFLLHDNNWVIIGNNPTSVTILDNNSWIYKSIDACMCTLDMFNCLERKEVTNALSKIIYHYDLIRKNPNCSILLSALDDKLKEYALLLKKGGTENLRIVMEAISPIKFSPYTEIKDRINEAVRTGVISTEVFEFRYDYIQKSVSYVFSDISITYLEEWKKSRKSGDQALEEKRYLDAIKHYSLLEYNFKYDFFKLVSLWFNAIREDFNMESFQLALNEYENILQNESKNYKSTIDLLLAQATVFTRIGSGVIDKLNGSLRQWLNSHCNKENLSHCTRLVEGFTHLKAYNQEKIVLEFLSERFLATQEQIQRLAILGAGTGSTEVKIVRTSEASLYIDLASTGWNTDETNTFLNNLSLENKRLDYSLAINQWSKTINLEGFQWKEELVTNVLFEAIEKWFGGLVTCSSVTVGFLTRRGTRTKNCWFIRPTGHPPYDFTEIGILVVCDVIGRSISVQIYSLYCPDNGSILSDVVENNSMIASFINSIKKQEDPDVNSFLNSAREMILQTLEKHLHEAAKVDFYG